MNPGGTGGAGRRHPHGVDLYDRTPRVPSPTPLQPGVWCPPLAPCLFVGGGAGIPNQAPNPALSCALGCALALAFFNCTLH
jgi:hypothetical protein